MALSKKQKLAKGLATLELRFRKNDASWDCPVCGGSTTSTSLGGDYDDTQHYLDRVCDKCGAELYLLYTYQYSSMRVEGDEDSESPESIDESWVDQGPLNSLVFLCKGVAMLGYCYGQLESMGASMRQSLEFAASLVPLEDVPLILAGGGHSDLVTLLLTNRLTGSSG